MCVNGIASTNGASAGGVSSGKYDRPRKIIGNATAFITAFTAVAVWRRLPITYPIASIVAMPKPTVTASQAKLPFIDTSNTKCPMPRMIATCITDTTANDIACDTIRVPGPNGVTPSRRRIPCSRQVTSRKPTPRLMYMIAIPTIPGVRKSM